RSTILDIYFDDSLLSLNQNFTSPEDGIRYAGELLQKSGACTSDYIEEMIHTYHEFGPVIVLDNGVAMPHARPEKGGLKSAFSVVVTEFPVIFHHQEFDPVNVIIAICAIDSDTHIHLIQIVADLIERNIASYVRNSSKEQVLYFIQKSIERTLCLK
ncbi:TPA: PTS sugar transporter subunit IIA, partial [Escherichia coli]